MRKIVIDENRLINEKNKRLANSPESFIAFQKHLLQAICDFIYEIAENIYEFKEEE